MDPEISCAMVGGLGGPTQKKSVGQKELYKRQGHAEYPCFLIRDSDRDLVLQYVLVQSLERVSLLSWALIWDTQGYGQTSPPRMGISEDSNSYQSRDLPQSS